MHRVTAVLLLLAACLQAWSLHQPRTDYTLYPGVGFYKFYNISLNWSDAHDACLRDGAHLAILNSPTEASLLHALFTSTAGSMDLHSYLGFHDLFLSKNFTTIYGQPLNSTGYDQWGYHNCVGPGLCSSNGSSPNGCGALARYSPSHFWRNCDELLKFSCEIELWHDYEFYAGQGYYKLHREGKSWGDAWRVCQDEGANLAIINSAATELNTLHGILARYPTFQSADTNDRVHLGFHSKFNPTSYSTVLGGFLNSTGYFQWNANEPSGNGTCGGLVRNGQLYIGDCNARLAYFCEHPLN